MTGPGWNCISLSARSGFSASRSSSIWRIASTSSGGNALSSGVSPASSSVTTARAPSAAGNHRSNMAS
jgi:hypothetical protein